MASQGSVDRNADHNETAISCTGSIVARRNRERPRAGCWPGPDFSGAIRCCSTHSAATLACAAAKS